MSKLDLAWYARVKSMLTLDTMKFMLETKPPELSPLVLSAMKWDSEKMQREHAADRAEQEWVVRVCDGVPVIRGVRYDSDGGWTTWCVVPKVHPNGKPIDEERAWSLAERYGRVNRDRKYSHPGGPYQHPGWKSETNTRYRFLQMGGLDI